MKLRAQIDGMTGGVDIGANASTSAFKKYLFGDLGLPVLKIQEKRQEAADDETMMLLTEYCRKSVRASVCLSWCRSTASGASSKAPTSMDTCRTSMPLRGRIHPDLMPLGTADGAFRFAEPQPAKLPPQRQRPGRRAQHHRADGQDALVAGFFADRASGWRLCRDEKMPKPTARAATFTPRP